jgi:hypothetical protein
VGRYPAELLPNSLAESLEMFPVGRQIRRPFLETPDAATSELEGALATAFLLDHELQPASDDFGFGLPSLFLQLLESNAVCLAKAGMNIGFHWPTVARI